MVETQIILYSLRAKQFCKLAREEFGQRLDVLAVFGRFTFFHPRRERARADRLQVGVLFPQDDMLLAEFVMRTGEQRTGRILVH